MRSIVLAGLAAVAVAGCSEKEPQARAPLANGAVESGANPASFWYECSNNEKAQATYGRDAGDQPNAIVTVRGKYLTLSGKSEGTATRYALPDALSKGTTMVWVNRGAEAVWSELPNPGGEARVVATCKSVPPPNP